MKHTSKKELLKSRRQAIAERLKERRDIILDENNMDRFFDNADRFGEIMERRNVNYQKNII